MTLITDKILKHNYPSLMIRTVNDGYYKLIETKNQTKILILDEKDTFAWINVSFIGELLVKSHKSLTIDAILALGRYRIYDVKNEPDLTDLLHLELFVGDGKWQGYLLTTGLPTGESKRTRIIPTKETITNTSDNLSNLLTAFPVLGG